jgi:hypothetical protein
MAVYMARVESYDLLDMPDEHADHTGEEVQSGQLSWALVVGETDRSGTCDVCGTQSDQLRRVRWPQGPKPGAVAWCCPVCVAAIDRREPPDELVKLLS